MGMIVWSPLDGGFLSGRYRGPEDFTEDSRIARFTRMFQGSFDPNAAVVRRKLELVGELAKLADEAGVTLAQLAIAFTIEHPAVTSSIIGPRKMEHLETILAAGDLKLSGETLDRIDALVPPGSSLNPLVDLPSGTGKTSLRRSS